MTERIVNDPDHRQLGNRLDLFHQQDEGPGMIFWHPRGWMLYRLLEDYIRNTMRRAGFREVRTPQLLARSLWERSGHWDKFQAAMYALADREEARAYCLKPMSCPCHVQLFGQRVRSYRELPVRYSEFGACHRDEPSGALEGLKRTRAFTQDDAHVFCAPAQIADEVARFCELLRQVYRELGFASFDVMLATRPALRAGNDAGWDHAEAVLAEAAKAAQLRFDMRAGEGAFYGPKLEFHLEDSRGRRWQCGTIQLDFVLPERLDVSFVDADNQRVRPVMLHHAVLGSLERFIAVLLEHHEGWLPMWLASEQIVVATVSDAAGDYARQLMRQLEDANLRAVLDDRPERLERKLVDALDQCVPAFVAVGQRDARDGTLSLRLRDGSRQVCALDEGIARLVELARAPR